VAFLLRLYQDVFSNGADIALPAKPRMIFVVHGAVTIADRRLADGEAFGSEAQAQVTAGSEGATVWRWELVGDDAKDGVKPAAGGNNVVCDEKLSARLDTLPKGDLLLRGDSVAFPPGGCAYLHRHQGPGTRCLIEGGIRIDTRGHSTSYGPGGAWFESGPEPVFAQAAADRPSRFVRVMILPASYLGKSSVEYLKEEDKAKPKSQTYKIYLDMPISSVTG
jgi:hypothetical protein